MSSSHRLSKKCGTPRRHSTLSKPLVPVFSLVAMTCRLSNLTCPATYEYCLHPIAHATVPQCCGIHTVSNCNKVRQQTTCIHTTLLPHSAITWVSHVRPVPALRAQLGDLQMCCNCQWKRRQLKLQKPAQLVSRTCNTWHSCARLYTFGLDWTDLHFNFWLALHARCESALHCYTS